jgi:4-nitrophenyl phosphatase
MTPQDPAIAPDLADAIAYDENARRRLRSAKAFVFDMDGVLYLGNQPIPGVNDLFNALALREVPFMLATNNSTATAADYVAKLARMGIDVPEASIFTSGIATRDYLLANVKPDAGIFVVGMSGLREQLFTGTGFQAVQYGEATPDVVVVGLDTTFTYEKLSLAHQAIRAGASFVATNRDATLPTEHGLMPGAGTMVAAIVTATGQEPVVIGKPQPTTLLMALDKLGVEPHDAVMVGDRLDTDILAGQRAGMLTVLVLTGVSTRDEVATAEALPDLVFTDLNAMLEALNVDES